MHRSAEHCGCSHKVCSIYRCTGADGIGNGSVTAHTLGTILWIHWAHTLVPYFGYIHWVHWAHTRGDKESEGFLLCMAKLRCIWKSLRLLIPPFENPSSMHHFRSACDLTIATLPLALAADNSLSLSLPLFSAAPPSPLMQNLNVGH